MDPQYLILIAGALACSLLMGGAMWLMMRQMNPPQVPMQPPHSNAQRVTALQSQREALDQEIRELQAIQSLQTQREQLTQNLSRAGEAKG